MKNKNLEGLMMVATTAGQLKKRIENHVDSVSCDMKNSTYRTIKLAGNNIYFCNYAGPCFHQIMDKKYVQPICNALEHFTRYVIRGEQYDVQQK